MDNKSSNGETRSIHLKNNFREIKLRSHLMSVITIVVTTIIATRTSSGSPAVINFDEIKFRSTRLTISPFFEKRNHTSNHHSCGPPINLTEINFPPSPSSSLSSTSSPKHKKVMRPLRKEKSHHPKLKTILNPLLLSHPQP